MENREAFLMWNEISLLVSTALGLSLLARYDCANVVQDVHDRQTMRDSTSVAAVALLRQADAMLVDFEEYVNRIPHLDDGANKANVKFFEN